MKIVFEIDLMDDPAMVDVQVTVSSIEDYERVKRLYPPDPDQTIQGEHTYQDGTRYFVTTAWTSAMGRVDLTIQEPKALDIG